MINPNKQYKAKVPGKIVGIRYPGLEYETVVVDYPTGERVQGYTKDIPNFIRFSVGDKVHIGAQFSIISDAFRIKSMRKVRK